MLSNVRLKPLCTEPKLPKGAAAARKSVIMSGTPLISGRVPRLAIITCFLPSAW